MLHYYLSELNGSFVAQGFVFTCSELAQILLDLRVDFPRLSSPLEDLSAILYDNNDILKYPGDCLSNEKLLLEVM